MYTIGDLTKAFELSRSTLLYYDKQGLLSPSKRTESNYRLYSEADRDRLKTILQYKKTGISLEDIKKLLVLNRSDVTDILTERLTHIQNEMMVLKKQEEIIIAALMKEIENSKTQLFDRNSWSSLLETVGYSEEELHKWHLHFEADTPMRHTAFLEALGFDKDEIIQFKNMLKL